MMTPDPSHIKRAVSKVATRCGIDCCKEVAVDIEDGALLDDLLDDGQELSDDSTEFDMPEIVHSDLSDDEDPEVLQKKYGYGWQDIWDKRRTRRLDKEEEQRIAVGENAVADFIDASINDLTTSVTGLCRSADDGSRTEEFYDEDAVRTTSDPKPRLTDRSSLKSAETQDKRASMVLPELSAYDAHEYRREEAHQEGQD